MLPNDNTSVQNADLETSEGGGHAREIVGYEQVRAAAKDFNRYSSDFQGEADIRDYRQLPLEADPPRHTLFRSAIQPWFMAAAIEPDVPEFERRARALLDGLASRGGGDVVAEVAVPYVVGCLSVVFRRQQDYEELLGWGANAYTVDGVLSTATVDAYLERVLDEAEAHPRVVPEEQDIWDYVSNITVDGKPISRLEKHGIASVLLAGGRDTLVKLVTGFVWHLVKHPEDRVFLMEQPDAHNAALGELVRYLSPLPSIGRVERDPETGIVRNEVVELSFVSANLDRDVWEDPDAVNIHRAGKPHVGFGFGRHSCLGMNLATLEGKAFLRVLLDRWAEWAFAVEPQIEWREGTDGRTAFVALDAFRELRVTAAGAC